MTSTWTDKRLRFLAIAVALALPASAAASPLSGGTSANGSPPTHATGMSGGTSTSSKPTKSTSKPSKAKGKSKGRKAPPQPAVKITGAQCVPASNCSTKAHEVSTNGTLLLQGKGLKSGQAVAFPHSWGAQIARNSPSGRLRTTPTGLVVTVPGNAHSGEVAVILGGGRRSNL
jgi:hypothetical protein